MQQSQRQDQVLPSVMKDFTITDDTSTLISQAVLQTLASECQHEWQDGFNPGERVTAIANIHSELLSCGGDNNASVRRSIDYERTVFQMSPSRACYKSMMDAALVLVEYGVLRHANVADTAFGERHATRVARNAAQTDNYALQDYEMQMMLLEQQNKKRLLMTSTIHTE